MIELLHLLELRPCLLIVGAHGVILQPKLHLFKLATNCEIVQLPLDWQALLIGYEFLEKSYQIVEVELLKIYPKPPKEQFDNVSTLLSTVCLEDSQTLQSR
jgi:hypothetical protein